MNKKENEKIEKIIGMLATSLNQIGELSGKIEKIEGRLDILTKTGEFVEKAKEIIKLKKYITKSELMHQVGLKPSNWKVWKEIIEKCEEESHLFGIHHGTGRSETLIVSLNSGSLLSMASRFFKEIKKGQNITLPIIETKFNVDEGKAKEIVNIIRGIFKNRCKFSVQDKYMFYKRY